MYKWKGPNGFWINFFSERNYLQNIKPSNIHWKCRCFTTYTYLENIYTSNNSFVVGEDYAIGNYKDNFTKELPENPVFYFDASSSFPRTKLALTGKKRCIKVEKANIIVLGDIAEVKETNEQYLIFTDTVEIFCISINEFKSYFRSKLENIEVKHDDLGYDDFKGRLVELYRGKLKVITDPTETIKNFNNGTYKKPFILDSDLDKIINESLPDPDIDSLLAIRDMLNSTDRSVVKLGANMAAGFNLTKWPLTFRLLLGTTPAWANAYYGGNSVVIKQMWSTLKFTRVGTGLHYVNHLITTLNETYSKEDIDLATELARRMPEFEDWYKRYSKSFSTLPFIPNELKS